MKKYSKILRIIIYIAGLLILAFGIILNTKSGLGVSPIISVAYSISTIGNLNFGDTTFALYAIFVMIEMLLHTLTGRIPQTKGKNSLVLTLGKDLLQLPLSLVFTRFMNLFSGWIYITVNSTYSWNCMYWNWGSNVTEYAVNSKSRRRNSTNHCGLYT